eukprot:349707-Chlamydomonas_euryale.AAC.12
MHARVCCRQQVLQRLCRQLRPSAGAAADPMLVASGRTVARYRVEETSSGGCGVGRLHVAVCVCVRARSLVRPRPRCSHVVVLVVDESEAFENGVAIAQHVTAARLAAIYGRDPANAARRRADAMQLLLLLEMLEGLRL